VKRVGGGGLLYRSFKQHIELGIIKKELVKVGHPFFHGIFKELGKIDGIERIKDFENQL
jgi:hypothetical protein